MNESFEKTNRMSVPSPRVEANATGQSLFGLIERLLTPDRYFKEGIPLTLLPRIGFALLLILFYIGNAHYAEQSIGRINRLQAEVEALRADYITLKADLMVASKQSEIVKRVHSLGLKENAQPPGKILVTDGEY